MKSEHSDLFNIIKLLKSVIFDFIILIIVIIGEFIYYINQLDDRNFLISKNRLNSILIF